MGCTVIDHNESRWASQYNRRHARRGRENGAATYSRELVEHHVPVWQRFVPDGTVISTCPLLLRYRDASPLAVQYLHTYPQDDPLSQVHRVNQHLRGRADRIVYVTAYRALHLQIRAAGFESMYVPMTVDAQMVRDTAGQSHDRYNDPRALYFGNVTRFKHDEFREIQSAFSRHGWQLDVISDGKINGERVSQEDAWRIASRYWYGVAVGRCALELAALGLRVMVSGAAFGGLVTTEAEWQTQTTSNFNGRVTTFDRDRDVCIESFHLGLVRPESNSTDMGTAVLRDAIIGLHARGWFE